MTEQDDRQELIGTFLTEAADRLANISAALHPADQSEPTPEALQEQYVMAHNLHGAASLCEFPGVAGVAAILETTLETATQVPAADWARVLAMVHDLVETLRSELKAIEQLGFEDQRCLEQWRARNPGHQSDSSAPPTPESLPESYLIPNVDPEDFSVLATEADEYLRTIDACLARLQQDLDDPETTQQLFRTVHTLKGSAYMVGVHVVGDLTHPVENILGAICEGRRRMTPELVALMDRATGVVRLLIQGDPRGLEPTRQDFADVMGRLKEMDQETSEESDDAPTPDPVPESDSGVQEDHEPAPQPRLDSPPAPIPESLPEHYLIPDVDPNDMSVFAMDAEEYLATIEGCLLRLEQEPDEPETSQRLVTTIVTLKQSAYKYKLQVIGDLARRLEQITQAIGTGQRKITPEFVELTFRALDVLRLLMRRDPRGLENTRRDFADAMTRLSGSDPQPVPVQSAQVHPTQSPPPSPDAPSQTQPKMGSPPTPTPESLPEHYLIPDVDPNDMSVFATEAEEYLATIESCLLRLEQEPDEVDTSQRLFRTFHTLKGSAYMIGMQVVGDMTHYVEDFMGAICEGQRRVTPALLDLMFRVIDVTRLLMRRDPRGIDNTRRDFAEVMARLSRADQPAADMPGPSPTEAATPQAQESEKPSGQESASSDSLQKEVIRVARVRIEALLNRVGELIICRGRLEQRIRDLEQSSRQLRASENRLVDAVHTFEEKHAFTLPTASLTREEPSSPTLESLGDFGSLEFDKYDDFNILARRIAELSADVGESMTQLDGSIRKAREDMGQLQRLTLSMRDEITGARMVPIGGSFNRFRRAAREMARACGKEIRVIAYGEQTEVDTGVVDRLVDPLVHIVRNAVYHGIEKPALRAARGKPIAGTISLRADCQGNNIVIEIEDDGGGINVEKVKEKAVEAGILRPELSPGLSEAEAMKLMFHPGLSTAEEVGSQAGRGVGMDVVKRTLDAMHAHLDIETELGKGTKFRLTVPLTFLIVMALVVRAEGERYAIPLPGIREVLLPHPNAVVMVGGRATLQVGEEVIEVHSLARILGEEPSAPPGSGPLVIARNATGVLGFGVDEILVRQEVVIKTLGTLKLFEDTCFGGATIDPEGRVILVLDVDRLLAKGGIQAGHFLARHGSEEPYSLATQVQPRVPGEQARETQPSTTRVLLIDDSLSVRKVVKGMLEKAGFTVETAVDGEEGLRKALHEHYQVIITDLEMPKLNGYEVIQALRDAPQTQKTPIIVMTTRAGEKHRQMSMRMGASSHLAKPAEQRTLIREVERWMKSATGASK